jgi:hypothetical protein
MLPFVAFVFPMAWIQEQSSTQVGNHLLIRLPATLYPSPLYSIKFMTEGETQDWLKFQAFAMGQLDHFSDRQNFIGLAIDPSFERIDDYLCHG